jgi:hypothetical protein
MSLRVIEGTWEEIERHKAELIGFHLRVTIRPERAVRSKPDAVVRAPEQGVLPKKLTGRGAFTDALPSTEEYMRQKRAEIEIEERHEPSSSTKRISALGKYAFVAGGSESFAKEKQAEIEREDRPRQ